MTAKGEIGGQIGATGRQLIHVPSLAKRSCAGVSRRLAGSFLPAGRVQLLGLAAS
jgi:hypothetical protein